MLDKRQQLTMLASIKEFWAYNKNYIYVLPFICLIVFVLYLIRPGSYLNFLIFDPVQLESPYAVAQQMTYGYNTIRVILTIIIPIMIVLCSHNYLMNIKKQSRFLTTPITDGQRILTLWLFAIVITIIGTLTFYLLDVATVAIFKHYMWGQVQTLNESLGSLYVHYDENSYFTAIGLDRRILLGTGFLLMLPYYHLMYFLFKKRSLLFSSLLYILLISITVYIASQFLYDANPRLDLPVKDVILRITNLLIAGLYIISLHFALKEREV